MPKKYDPVALTEAFEKSQQLLLMRNRPMRLAFVVKTNTPYDAFNKVLKYNTSLWGGRYNLFCPTNGQDIRADWWNILYRHDPDLIFYVGEMTPELTTRIFSSLQPFWHFNWSDDLNSAIRDNRDSLNGILMSTVFAHFRDRHGSLIPEKTNCFFPLVSKTKYSKYLATAFGSYVEESECEIAYRSILAAKEVECAPHTLFDYLTLIDELEAQVSPLDVTGQYLQLRYSSFFADYDSFIPNIIVSNGSIEDLCLLHILRSTSFAASKTVIIPSDDLKVSENVALLAKWIAKRARGNGITVGGNSLSWAQLRSLRETLRATLPERSTFPENWIITLKHCNVLPDIPEVFHEERQILATSEGRKLTISFPSFFLEQQIGIENYIYEFDSAAGSGQAGIPAPIMFSSLNQLLGGFRDPQQQAQFRGGNVRIARGSLAHRASKKTSIRALNIPTDTDFVVTALGDAHYTVQTEDSKDRYYSGMIRILGGHSKARVIRDEYLLRLFQDETFRTGTPLTMGELIGKMKAGNQRDNPKYIRLLHDLAEKQILLRGYDIRCPTCKTRNWYEPRAMAEVVVCKGCLSRLQPAMDTPFSYRLNQLFVAGLKEGALAQLLTLLLLQDTARKAVISQSSCVVMKDTTKTELDLIAMCDGALVIAECKDSFDDSTQQKRRALKKQLDSCLEVARDLKADLFLFATLQNKALPEEILAFAARQNKHAGSLVVKIVERSELVRGYISIEELEAPNGSRRATIGDLLDKSLPHYGGHCFEDDPQRNGSWIFH